jgi:hypothetical protein
MYAATAHGVLMDGYDEYGLRIETDFIDDAIGVDPESCGCTDCIVGNSIRFDNEEQMARLAKAAAYGGRKVINRTSAPLALVENYVGEVRFVELHQASIVHGVYAAD